MKLNLIKRSIALALFLPLLLTGCGSNELDKKATSNELNTTEEKTYKIGISQYMEHPSLDEARDGFTDEMEELGVKIEVDYINAQGDTSNTQVIAEKFVKNKVDMIYSIATLSTQAAKKATEKTNIPVLFTAVTDPVFSQIVKSQDEIDANVTGVTDKVESPSGLKKIVNVKTMEALGLTRDNKAFEGAEFIE